MTTEDIISLTEFKNDAAGWIKRLEKRPPVVLTQNGKGVAVVQSYEEYERSRVQLALLMRVNRALADDRAGRSIPHVQVMQEMRDLLKQRLAERA
jgi:prevent-host-death family protein